MTDELVLYTNPQSRGRIARWMLEEVGATYRTEVLEYNGSMKSPDYLRINPMGKVPTVMHGQHTITECAAICAYLADAFPDAGLAPTTDERANYYRWLFFVAGPMEAAITDTKVLGMAPSDEQKQMVGYGSYDAVMNTLAQVFETRDYVAGDRFTAADVYVGAQINWGLEFGTVEKRPVLQSYAERTRAREAYQRATELDDALVSN